MLLDREQHIHEAARHMGPDRLVFERARQRGDGLFIGGNREVVRPEMYQPLPEWRVGYGREFIPAGRLGLVL